jgi:hypothetical protein
MCVDIYLPCCQRCCQITRNETAGAVKPVSKPNEVGEGLLAVRRYAVAVMPVQELFERKEEREAPPPRIEL